MPLPHQGISQFSSLQSLSHVQLFATLWTAACQALLSITNSRSLLKLMSIESVMPSNHLILCCPLILLPSIFPSSRVFSNESVLRIRWPKYWSFSFSISLSNEYLRLISLRMDWLDLLAVQWTLKSLLQHHSSKASILWHSAFLLVQLSYPYMTTFLNSSKNLKKQGENIQPWSTPFPIWNQSIVPCTVLTIASWPAYRFLRKQVGWCGIPISWRIFQFVVIHTVKGFSII